MSEAAAKAANPATLGLDDRTNRDIGSVAAIDDNRFLECEERDPLAYARSSALHDTTHFWQWMWLPGDGVFAFGALLMVRDFIVKPRSSDASSNV